VAEVFRDELDGYQDKRGVTEAGELDSTPVRTAVGKSDSRGTNGEGSEESQVVRLGLDVKRDQSHETADKERGGSANGEKCNEEMERLLRPGRIVSPRHDHVTEQRT
jgi:hypothetical protein